MLALTLVCLALVALLAFREWVGLRERRELYQRIQTPHLARREVAGKRKPSERARLRVISAEDDAAFIRRKEEAGHVDVELESEDEQ